MLCKLLRDVRLARPRWAVEDDLALFGKPIRDALLQPRARKEELTCNLIRDGWQLRFRLLPPPRRIDQLEDTRNFFSQIPQSQQGPQLRVETRGAVLECFAARPGP